MTCVVLFIVVVAVMYDQCSNGAQMETKRLGRSIAMEQLLQQLDEEVGMRKTVATVEWMETGVVGKSKTEAAEWMEAALQYCCSPPQRLRTACLGRNMRADSTEDGLVNAVEVLMPYITGSSNSSSSCSSSSVHNPVYGEQKGSTSQYAITETTTVAVAGSDRTVDQQDCNELIVLSNKTVLLPNGLEIAAHIQYAPEETLFLYQEIFVEQVYQRYVRCLQPGDLVVDIGKEEYSTYYYIYKLYTI